MEVELKRVPGTRDVYTIGGPRHVLRVLVEPERMNAYHVTMQDLRNALQLANASQPSGSLVRDNREVLIETGQYWRARGTSGAGGACPGRPPHLSA